MSKKMGLNIIMHVAGLPFDGDTIANGESLGGSETAGYSMAKELVNLGHDVTIFTNKKVSGVYQGVKYEHIGNRNESAPHGDRFALAMRAPRDVLIVQRDATVLNTEYNTRMNILWLHDLALHRMSSQTQKSLWNIDRILCVSEYHKKQVAEVYGIDEKYIIATTNGIDPAMFPKAKPHREREPNSMIYTSRPERGLENLVGANGIMHKLKECKLYVCGYDNTTENMRDYYEYLWDCCRNLPNVELVGSLGKADLYDKIGSVMAHIYPTDFEETSCIAVMEAQKAGTPVISTQVGALPETLKGGGAILQKQYSGELGTKGLTEIIQTVRDLMENESKWAKLSWNALGKDYSWHNAGVQWDKEINDCLATKADRTPDGIVRHLIRHSDIILARHYAKTQGDKGHQFNPKTHKLLNATDWARTDASVIEQNRRHHDMLYTNRNFPYYAPNIKQQGRVMAVSRKLGELPDGCNIVDLAPSEGALTIALAEMNPKHNFICIEIEPRNIKAMTDRLQELKIENVTVINGDVTKDIAKHLTTADVVLACEILEHLRQPSLTLQLINDHAPKGTLVIMTTPYGLTDGSVLQRAHHVPVHLSHFEKFDLENMLGHFEEFKITTAPTIYHMGNLITWFRTDPVKSVMETPIEEKLARQKYHETVTLCMIAKDAGHDIAKAINSVYSFTDEIIVAVDSTTQDDTAQVAHKYGAKILEIDPAVEIGFDRARNKSIKYADTDWIIWLDADEEFQEPINIRKYLRANSLNGYAVKQHHFATTPLGCFQTDYPIRIFRNRKGIKFFGHVHEHPETELNKGVGHAGVLPDVSIIHTAYANEGIRRGRFQRNFPMMQVDRERHPQRTLGKFLWMRDVTHFIRYKMEANGGVVEPDIHELAREGLAIWRSLLKGKHLRMVLDGLPFVSVCNDILSHGQAIEYTMNIGASRMNGGAKLLKEPLTGKFASVDDIKKLTDLCINDKVRHYESKYF